MIADVHAQERTLTVSDADLAERTGDDLKSALVAEERDPADRRSFYGFWTYDPGVVDRVRRVVESDGGRRAGEPPVA